MAKNAAVMESMSKGTQSQPIGDSIRRELANMGPGEMLAFRASETISANIKSRNILVDNVVVLASANMAVFADNVCLAEAKVSASMAVFEICANDVPGAAYACTGDSATNV